MGDMRAHCNYYAASAFLHPPKPGGALNKPLYVSGPDSFSPHERVWLCETSCGGSGSWCTLVTGEAPEAVKEDK